MFKISARNQFWGTVAEVRRGAVNGIVTIDTGAGLIKADITNEAIDDLALEAGRRACAIVKATNVMFAKGVAPLEISARNQFPGVVTKVVRGAVNGHVSVTARGGLVFSGSVTNEAIEELGLAEGSQAVAFVKSTDVLVGVEED